MKNKREYEGPRVEVVEFLLEGGYTASMPMEVETFRLVVIGEGLPSQSVECMTTHSDWGDGDDNRFF